MDHKKSTGKMAKALVNSNFVALVNIFMDSSDYEIPSCKILYLVRGTATTGGIKQMGTHNRSDNYRGARVALRPQPPHTDTGTTLL
jgi:hypothetical protein